MKFIIPSFQRPDILKQKTLNLLINTYHVRSEDIDILLEDPKEGDTYRNVLGDLYPKDFIFHYQKGIGSVRNFIKHYYKYESKEINVIYIDDDIDEIRIMDKQLPNLIDFVNEMFKETENRKLNLWGVSAFHNPFFMSETITQSLKYICGAFNGEIIDRDKHDIYTEFDHLEDFAFSCEHFIRDGGVVRNNGVCIVTKYFGDGGINASYGGLEKRKIAMAKAVIEFKERYGDMCKIIEKKYGADIRLNHWYKNE
tara:strand:- start:326 stop:1087 length:762 start_codon:yes stop_codon:yes gene_type:complete